MPQSLSQPYAHHTTRKPSPVVSLQEELRKLLDAHGIAYGERYMWD
jgi:hypothetical protein